MRDRYEFLDKLRQNLTGRVDQTTINETVQYYQEYFETQMRSGREEMEILSSLGDPRLLAKTIIQTQSQTQTEYVNEEYTEQTERTDHHVTLQFGNHSIHMPRWMVRVLLAIAGVLLVVLILTVFWYLLPIIIVITAVVLIFKVVRDLIS